MENLKDYINNLKSDKQKLVNNLVGKGIEASNDETFTTLVNKVNAINGVDIEECFETTYIETSSVSTERNVIAQYLTKIPWIDTSNATYMGGLFYFCRRLKEIPLLDTSNVTTMRNFCWWCDSLETIPLLDTSNVIDISSAFYPCFSLTNLGGFKDLGKAYDTTKNANYSNYTLGLSSASNLTHESALNVLNGLYDIASKGCQPQKVSFHSNVIALLSEEEIAIGTNKGWTVATN